MKNEEEENQLRDENDGDIVCHEKEGETACGVTWQAGVREK